MPGLEAHGCGFALSEEKYYTVKLGYNEHGYNEFMAIASK
jgi:hypothetical protein